jgi:putative endonuclease
MNWYVYMILCSDNSLYTGITTDVERRLSEHAAQTGAKYFRGRMPQRLVYLENGHTRSSASRREAAIKKMRRGDKQQLILSELNQLSCTVAGTAPSGQQGSDDTGEENTVKGARTTD